MPSLGLITIDLTPSSMYSEELRRLLAELNLKPDPDDIASTRGAILSLIASLHPDKTGGSFADKAQREKFDHALKLRELFDREMAVSTQMVPIQQVSSLIEAIAKAQALAQVKDQPPQLAAQEQFRRRLKGKYAFPKITSALIATLCFTLFTFMGNFKNSPFSRLAISIFANGEKVKIINRINHLGGILKMNEARTLMLDDVNRYERMSYGMFINKLETRNLINMDDWPNSGVWLMDEDSIPWLELNTAIADIDLYSSDEAELFKPLEEVNTQIGKAVSPGVTALTSELKKREKINQGRSRPDIAPTSDDSFDFHADTEHELKNAHEFLFSLQRDTRQINEMISDLRTWLPKAKKQALNSAERNILLTLAAVIILACCAFVVIWLRERSDQRWVEFISSDEGLELVFMRLCTNKEIASRTPPKFQLLEFTQVLARKDVPPYLTPALGAHLDGKELSQVASSLIARLKENKVITQVKTPTIQQWFEITAVDFTDVAKDKGHEVDAPSTAST